jgi:hypothetical protein
MSQGETKVLVDNMYSAVLTIVGMPNSNGGSSTSDTGLAVVYRDGWSEAESYAKNTESTYKLAERRFLKLLLRICHGRGRLDGLRAWDVKIQFTRRNYENISMKSNVLITMLQSGQIHPRLAFEHCGMFPDPDLAYKMSMEWVEEQEKKAEEKQRQLMAQQKELQDEEKTDTRDGGEDREPAESRQSGGSTGGTGQDNDR